MNGPARLLLRQKLALVAAAVAVAAAGCEAPAGTASLQEVSRELAPLEVIQVRTVSAGAARYRGWVVTTGDLRAEQSAALGFTVGGRLDRIEAKRGQMVRSGQVLGVLDASLARESLAQAKAGVEAAEVQLRLAEDAVTRTVAIGLRGGVAEAQVLQTTAQRDLAAAQLASAKAQAAQAEINLRYHTLRAPFDAVVTQVPSGRGITVGPGSPLFGLEATSSLVLEVSLTPAQAAGLASGAPARVTVPGTGEVAEGVVRAVVPAAEPAAHRIPVEIAVPNPARKLFANVLARAELRTGERPALELPATALVQRDGGLSVWTLAEGSRARRLSVQLFTQEGDRGLVEFDEALARARIVDMPPADLAEDATLAARGTP